MSSEPPKILLLSLALRDSFFDKYSVLLDKLLELATVEQAQTSDEALTYLDAYHPKAIIVTDEGLTDVPNEALVEKIKTYTENGGLTFVGLNFQNHGWSAPGLDQLFRDTFGLRWRHGGYFRTTFKFNPSCARVLHGDVRLNAFPKPYSMRAWMIEGAKKREKIVMGICGSKRLSVGLTASAMDEWGKRANGNEAAVVGTEIGDGTLIYIGDENHEDGTNQLILTLCGF